MKNSKPFTLLLILNLIFLANSITAQSNNNYSDLIKESEDFIKQRMESDHIIGMSAAIIINDSVILKNGFGYADNRREGL